METIRTFIAVLLPDEVRQRLADIEKGLMASKADVKWVPASNFHITLKFLGNVDAESIDCIKDAIAPIAAETEAFDAGLSGVGAFPKPSRPKVVWVGISSGAEQMKALAKRIEDAMESLGFAREERGFSAHITIGRLRTPQGVAKLTNAIENTRDAEAGSFRVGSIALMKSDLRPTGATYKPIAEFEFVKN